MSKRGKYPRTIGNIAARRKIKNLRLGCVFTWPTEEQRSEWYFGRARRMRYRRTRTNLTSTCRCRSATLMIEGKRMLLVVIALTALCQCVGGMPVLTCCDSEKMAVQKA